jgi:tetratricopeptide (TPR) repeat protein
MNEVIPKAFIEAILLFPTDPGKVKKYFQDKRLTWMEKQILEAMFLIRDNKSSEAIDLLSKLNDNALPDTRSCRYYLLGLCLNNVGRFEESSEAFFIAYDLLTGTHNPRLKFVILNNLLILNLNLENKTECRNILTKLVALGVADEKQKMSILRAQFNVNSIEGKYDEAAQFLKSIRENWSVLLPAQIGGHLYDEFDYHIKKKDFDSAENVLIEMKSYRKYMPSSNYKYMKLLLNFIAKNSPMYFSPQDFVDLPLFSSQLSCLSALEGGDLEEAEFQWGRLHQISPHLYGSNFSYTGTACLFSLALEKLSPMLKRPKQLNSLPRKKEEALYEVLRSYGSPVPKEELYELLWEEPYKDKNDLRKMIQLIHHVKKSKSLNILYRKGCYFIQDEDDKKSA